MLNYLNYGRIIICQKKPMVFKKENIRDIKKEFVGHKNL